MIKTLEDVRIYSEDRSARSPLIADEIRIPSPGLSSDELARVREALPGLPNSFLEVVAQLDLEAAQIEFFLSPCSYGKRRGEMVRCLLERNSDENYFFDLLTDNQLYEVGSWEGDPICVATRNATRPGEVTRIDHETQTMNRIANDFEQLVIGLGRLNEQDRESGPRGQVGVELFLMSVSEDFGLDDEQMQEWTWLAEMSLLDEDD
jgi:hypothetical protein